MDYEKKIDIPFGAKDSELKCWEYTIPEGMEAIIKDGKVLVREKESEDEKIRKGLIAMLSQDKDLHHKEIAYLEKLKDASKAIEAVDRIYKYIEVENVANAHDMNDSNLNKKYYCGWNDALGKIAGILQDVYSDEKQKEIPKSDSTKMIEMWDEEKKILERMYLRGDTWRLIAYNAFIDGIARGNLVKFEKQKEQKSIEDIVKDITKNKEVATKFLKSAGIMDENGELAEMYRSEQKPTEWSDDTIRKAVKEVGLTQHQIDWFKTNVFPPKQEWSEKDEERIQSILFSIGYCKDEYPNKKDYLKDIAWLKALPLSLKKRNEDVAKLCSNEWSEEDERMLEVISYKISQHQGNDERSLFTPDEAEFICGINDKLKSLRPSWKPSEEQIEAFECAERWYSDNMGCNIALHQLLCDIKNL